MKDMPFAPTLRLPEGEDLKMFKLRWSKMMDGNRRGKPLRNLPYVEYSYPPAVAQIVITEHCAERLPGHYDISHTFEWKGDPSLPVWIDRRIVDPAGIDALPWALQAIGEHGSTRSILYARTDGRNIVHFWYHCARVTLQRAGREFKYRTIYILMVLGLAYIPHGEVPSWRHIGKKAPQ